jgi:bifunctional UDP-N-acetylglucosamine pyrophosphorylase/glucosamine-1-phosphate N-acetyltransferase
VKTACVVLAAGLGKRMKSSLPKVLHRICGTPMLQNVVFSVKKLQPERIIVVAGGHIGAIKEAIGSEGLSYVLQKEAKGTGHAVLCARSGLRDFKGDVLIVNGDTPLISHSTLRKFLKLHRKDRNLISVLSFDAAEPASYGRIVRDASGHVVSIVEDKDADTAQKSIREVNSGAYILGREALSLLDGIRKNSLSGEYYLTDIIHAASLKGLRVSAYRIGTEDEFMGVNTREELQRAAGIMKKNIAMHWTAKGVTFMDAESVFIHPEVCIGRETVIYPHVSLEGCTRIGRGAVIYPHVRIHNSRIGNEATVKDSSVIEDSVVKDRASVGPFAHLRPGSEVGRGARIGNFVELKKAIVGQDSKASHLSYLGDTKIGKGVNIGAGTITCNYDGEHKHLTVIEDRVFIGSDSQLVAPVRIGKGAYIGAGSTITSDVPPDALAISRARQENVEGWAKRRNTRIRTQKAKIKAKGRHQGS